MSDLLLLSSYLTPCGRKNIMDAGQFASIFAEWWLEGCAAKRVEHRVEPRHW